MENKTQQNSQNKTRIARFKRYYGSTQWNNVIQKKQAWIQHNESCLDVPVSRYTLEWQMDFLLNRRRIKAWHNRDATAITRVLNPRENDDSSEFHGTPTRCNTNIAKSPEIC